METKKIVVPTIVAIVTLIVLTVGATYAYFTFDSSNSFGTQTIEASTGALGSGVSLTKTGSNLTLAVTATQMLEANTGTTYYATGSATPQNIAKIAVAGEGTFNCTYTLTITKSSTSTDKDLYTKFQAMSTKSANQVYLTVNDTTYDFNTASLFSNNVITYNGTLNNITSAQDNYITANLAIANTSVDQTALNDSDITLTFAVPSFTCTLVGE